MGIVLRLVILNSATAIEIDSTHYAMVADQLMKGYFGRALNSVFPPVYPAFVALFHLFIPDLELAGRLVSLISATLLICLSYLFSKRVFQDETKALWTVFVVAFHPLLARYSSQVLSESLTTLLFTLTVYLFYVGWQEDKRMPVAISGICLVLTYLARPEYLVFYGPFMLILLMKRRIVDVVTFFFPFLVLGTLYILYLHAETGLWIISKKATLSPFVGLSAFLGNIPLVVYGFFLAITPLYFALAVLGYRKVEGQYRGMVILLVLVHILSLSFISHATKRYSIEFAPMCALFAVEGISVLRGFLLDALPWKRILSFAIVLTIGLVGIWQSYLPPRFDRALEKKAGLFLADREPGAVIASRLPIGPFYAKGTAVPLLSEMAGDESVDRLKRVIAEKKVRYLMVDLELEKELPVLREYVRGSNPVCEFRHGEDFVRVFEIPR